MSFEYDNETGLQPFLQLHVHILYFTWLVPILLKTLVIRNSLTKPNPKMLNSETLFFFNPFPNKPWFLHVCSTSLSKHCGKRRMLIMSNFSSSHNVFYTFGEISAIFIHSEIVVCKLFSKSCCLGKG